MHILQVALSYFLMVLLCLRKALLDARKQAEAAAAAADEQAARGLADALAAERASAADASQAASEQ